YLFVGPSSIGKSMMAVRFAAGLLDPPEGSEEAKDRSMRLALAQSHPDLVVVEPQGVASIGVDQAREVVRKASMAPVEGARTVFLIPEAGTLTEQAANALLKTLEEPGATVVFLLVAESEDQFPATIASRCRVVRMGRVPDEVLTEALVARGLEPARAGGLAVVSAGRPGRALALMTRPEVAGWRGFWLAMPAKVTARGGVGRPARSGACADDQAGGGELQGVLVVHPGQGDRPSRRRPASRRPGSGGDRSARRRLRARRSGQGRHPEAQASDRDVAAGDRPG